MLRGRRIEQNEPRRPAVAQRQTVEEIEDSGITLGRKARDGDRADLPPADARRKSSAEILSTAHGVEIHWHRRKVDSVVVAGQAGHQVAEQVVLNVDFSETILNAAPAQTNQPQRR